MRAALLTGYGGVGKLELRDVPEPVDHAWAERPASLDPIDAGALPLVVLTGTQLIEEAVRPRPGEVVLVTGAVGSVGRAAVSACSRHWC